MTAHPHLVLLETSGNQAYLFGTNKLREVVGASQLTYEVGTTLVREAVAEVFDRNVDLQKLKESEPVLGGVEAKGVEVIVATSGKALLLVEDREKAAKLITAWSRRVLTEMPGLDATGVISEKQVDLALEPGNGVDGAVDIGTAVREVHAAFEAARTRRRAPQARFPRLPVVAACRSSDMPAAELVMQGSEPLEVSRTVACKRSGAVAKRAARRIADLLPRHEDFLERIDDLERFFDADWVAVVHADGNGLGQIFMGLDAALEKLVESTNEWVEERNGASRGRLYVDAYRELSTRLDEVSRDAIRTADETLSHTRTQGRTGTHAHVACVPLVVGGDDLTAVVSGPEALAFTCAYLEAFMDGTKTAGVIPELAEAAGLGGRALGICAGVAIVKPHFPFSVAYDLAAELIREAKRVKEKQPTPACAIDFHILYDSSATSLAEIRRRMHHDQPGYRRTAKPLVVKVHGTQSPWSEQHAWRRLVSAVEALRTTDDDGSPRLPRSQAQALREALTRDERTVIDREWELLKARHPGFAEAWPSDLFVSNETVFLDALEATQFF